MGKTFKKKDLKEYIDEEELLDEDELNELIDIDGGLISHKDNYKATDKVVKAKGTVLLKIMLEELHRVLVHTILGVVHFMVVITL
jgi:hypothetical protein